VTAGPLPDLDATAAAPDAAIADLRHKGHAVVRGLASPSEIAAYRPGLEAGAEARRYDHRPLEERDTYGRAFVQSANLWQHDEACRAFATAPRFARVAAELLGTEGVRMYHDQALFKEPHGGHTPWHQDQFYWPLDTEDTVTAWIALDDIGEDVGSMTFAAGSHLDGDLRGREISDQSEKEFSELVTTKGFALETHGAMRSGDATFHKGWTLHRAGSNPTDRMRPAMTIIYFADGARVAQPDSNFQEFDLAIWLQECRPGDPAAGPLNPLLWPRG
jgi:ectoine hydroxylase-related dioxygenase (phytanoyl-CoA dioxygenase family)